ncbi:MAG TPA: Gfo/Idh/MocA family oxidoreductase [Actinopolymorphaceae bacterium]
MPTTPVRVAIVGLDHWYTAIPLARALAGRPDAKLVAIVDADLTRAQEVAARVKVAKVTTNADEVLADQSVDLIAAFASTDTNPATCIAAAEAGKHILSIKPIARTVEEATRIRDAVRKAGVVFIPAECRSRRSALHQRLRQWRDDGRFGEFLTASFALWSPLPQAWPGATDPGWFADPDRAPGGGWIDHSIYHIDLMRWLFDAHVTSITGRIANLKYPDLPLEDYGHATVDFSNGVVATVEDTWTAPTGFFRTSMGIVGTDLAVTYDSATGRLSVTDPRYGGWTQLPALSTQADDIDDILAAVRGEADPIGTVDDAWENVAACQAFYQACASRTSVTPEQLPA